MKRPAVAYVVMSFPQPSETFIAEEALSLLDFGIEPVIVAMYQGPGTPLHASAARLIDRGAVLTRRSISRLAALRSLASLMLRRPGRVLAVVPRALRNRSERWLYFQVLPIAAELARRGVCRLHAHFADRNLQLAQVLADWLGVPYGVTTHRYDLLDDLIPPAEASVRMAGATPLVTISRFNRDLMVSKFGLRADAIAIVHCGVDLGRLPDRRTAPGARTGDLRLLSVGRLVPAKGHDILLRAVADLGARGVSVRLDIIGEGPLRADLEAQAAQLGIADRVTLLGARAQEEVFARLAACDVFVLASRSEGIPVACMEAMAMAVPAVATAVNGLPELIDDGATGRLVPPEDPQALADAIAWFAADPGRMAMIARRGHDTVRAQFERSGCTRQLVALFGLGD
jgi:glycosyltransferase involved in cell wall biosynthesis